MDPTGAMLLAGGGQIGGGILSYMGQQGANQANMQIADKQMNFQAQQSGSAYRTATSDMISAGLNPAMMYGSGSKAEAPGGASQTMQNTMSGLGQSVASSASQMPGMVAALRKAKAEADIAENNADVSELDKGVREKAQPSRLQAAPFTNPDISWSGVVNGLISKILGNSNTSGSAKNVLNTDNAPAGAKTGQY